MVAGINLPEGVDPSFLAALPEDIRREVLQNQLGIRPPSRPPVTTTLAASTGPVLGGPGVTEVSPEFLAALPPAIQEEVKTYIYIKQMLSQLHGKLNLSTKLAWILSGSCSAASRAAAQGVSPAAPAGRHPP